MTHVCLQTGKAYGGWTEEEDAELIRLQGQLGNKWKEIGRALGRRLNAVSKRWHVKLRDAHCQKTGECIYLGG